MNLLIDKKLTILSLKLVTVTNCTRQDAESSLKLVLLNLSGMVKPWPHSLDLYTLIPLSLTLCAEDSQDLI